MRVVHQASPWRALFDQHGRLNTVALDAPLQQLFSKLSSPPTSFANAPAWQFSLVETLVHYDLPAWRISQIISDHNACDDYR